MGAGIPRSALLTVWRSIWNSVAKIVTFVHHIWEECCKNRAKITHPWRDSRTRTSDSAFQTITVLEQFSNNFVVHFRMVVSCSWSPLQTATGRILYNMK